MPEKIERWLLKKTVLGKEIFEYKCPACKTLLRSDTEKYDQVEDCPDCNCSFLLPNRERLDRRRTKQSLGKNTSRSASVGENEDSSDLPSSFSTEPKTQNLSKVTLLRKDPLLQWRVYFFSITIVLSFMGGRLIFEAVITDTSGICAVITLIFIAATVKNLLDILYLRREIKASNAHITELLELRRVDVFVSKDRKGLLAEHIYNLYQMSLRDDAVNQESLIILLQNKLTSRLSMTGILGGLLVTLGLVGTIVGLINSVSGLGEVMNAVGSDSDGLMEGMQETLGGMGTAFFTTLIGAMLGAVALRILAGLANSNANTLVAHIAELTEIYIAPTLRKSAKKRILLEMKEHEQKWQHKQDELSADDGDSC